MAIWFRSKALVTFGNPKIEPEDSASQASEKLGKLEVKKGSSSTVIKLSRILNCRGKSQGCGQEGSFVSRGIRNGRKGNP